MNDCKYALEIMNQELSNKFISPEITYAFVTCIDALEKQIPRKPEFYGDSEDGKLLCPSCGEDLWDIKECGFSGCPYCLQAIDWRNKDE